MTVAAHIVREALTFHKAGRLAEAKALYEAALARQPDMADAIGLSGLVALQSGAADEASALLERALDLDADSTDFIAGLGEAYRLLGRVDAAIDAFRQALAREPDHVQALNNLGLAHLDSDAEAEAQRCFLTALDHQVDFAPAWANLSVTLRRRGDTRAALATAQRAVEIDPGAASALVALGAAQAAFGQAETALATYRHAALRGRNDAHAMVAYALALKEAGQVAESTAWLRRAATRGHVEALYNLAVNLHEAGAIEESITTYRQVIDRAPEHVAANKNLAVALLLDGQFTEGFDRWAWRWRELDTWMRAVDAPLWAGEPLAGRAILVWAEQGIGDEVMLATLLPDVIARAGRVTVECDPRLVPLFARAFPEAAFVARGQPDAAAPAVDYHVPLGDLCRWFRRAPDAFPEPHAYLRADPARTQALRERYRDLGSGPLVGLAWRSGGGSSNPHRRRFKEAKSTRLEDWGPVFAQRCTFINLQYGDCTAELAAVAARHGVTVHHNPTIDQMRDLEGFACQIAALDRVVATSGVAAHMAGALGQEVRVLLAHTPDWRWQRRGDRSLWYPGARLYRQSEAGDWTAPLTVAAIGLDA